mmetsp:Transcript_110228/g.213405  ORF Transcript_110228/g.213405 Transcript_110228/m.213405 type:complete len:130 (+) Transcript_110228:45-434(+)
MCLAAPTWGVQLYALCCPETTWPIFEVAGRKPSSEVVEPVLFAAAWHTMSAEAGCPVNTKLESPSATPEVLLGRILTGNSVTWRNKNVAMSRAPEHHCRETLGSSFCNMRGREIRGEVKNMHEGRACTV